MLWGASACRRDLSSGLPGCRVVPGQVAGLPGWCRGGAGVVPGCTGVVPGEREGETLSLINNKRRERESVCVPGWCRVVGVVPGRIVSIWLGGGGSTPALATKVCRNEVLQ
jgi:hypothetical protein